MQDANPVTTPAVVDNEGEKEGDVLREKFPHREAIGLIGVPTSALVGVLFGHIQLSN